MKWLTEEEEVARVGMVRAAGKKDLELIGCRAAAYVYETVF